MSDTTQPAAANVPVLDDYLKQATELGEQAGKGKDTQVKFALLLIEGGYLGTLSTAEKNKDKVSSDQFKLAAAYAKAQGIATVFDAKPVNQRKLMSNVKTYIDFGSNPKWGQGQPIGVVNDLLMLRQNLKKAGTPDLNDANNMLLRFIKVQKTRSDLIDGDELKSFCFKKAPGTITAEAVLEGVRKTVTKLAQGKVANCHDMDDSPEVKAILAACTKRLTAIAKAKGNGNGNGAKP